jgi:hypothetical protein
VRVEHVVRTGVVSGHLGKHGGGAFRAGEAAFEGEVEVDEPVRGLLSVTVSHQVPEILEPRVEVRTGTAGGSRSAG